MAEAYAFLAAEHGWTPRRIERELTDEHLILLLDEAVDRDRARAQARFDSMVEAVRVGTILAHDEKQNRRWRAARKSATRGPGLTGDALEAAIRGLAAMYPQNVVRGVMA